MLLQERHWTQRQLARQADLGEAEISRIISGRQRPYSGQARRIAKALRVQVKDLFPDEAPLRLSRCQRLGAGHEK
jgi:transcriptional regulator with XRE-family HTH domain